MTRWKTVLGKRFLKQYKSLDARIRQRADHAIEELKNSDSPAALGRWKQHKRVFTYNVGKYRIIYSIDRGNNAIEFLYVGDHKPVYGKD